MEMEFQTKVLLDDFNHKKLLKQVTKVISSPRVANNLIESMEKIKDLRKTRQKQGTEIDFLNRNK